MTKADAKAFGERVYTYRVTRDLGIREACSQFRIGIGTLVKIEKGGGCGDRVRLRIERSMAAVPVAA